MILFFKLADISYLCNTEDSSLYPAAPVGYRGVTRLANKLQTDLWDRFSGPKEGQAIMRAQPVLTTVLPDPLPSQDRPVLAPQSSPFHFKHKAITTCSNTAESGC